ncbi:MAG: flippase [Flavobacteriales bacterium]
MLKYIFVKLFNFKKQINKLSSIDTLKESFWGILLRVIGALSTYLFTYVVAQFYGASGVGIFAVSQSLIMVAVTVGRFGMDSTILRFSSQYSLLEPEMFIPVYKKIFKVVCIFSISISLLLLAGNDIIVKWLDGSKEMKEGLFWVSLAILPLSLAMIYSNALRGMKKVKAFIVLDRILPLGIGLILVLLSLNFIDDKSGPVKAFVIGIFITCLISIFLFYRNRRRGKSQVDHSTAESTMKIMRIAFPMLISHIMLIIMHWFDVFLLGLFKTEAEVGIYNTAMKVANLNTIAIFAVNAISATKFAEYYGNNDMENFKKSVKDATRLTILFSLPVIAIIFLFPGFIMNIFGNEFIQGTNVLLILATGQLINSLTGSVIYVLQMSGKEKAAQNALITGAIISIALNLILIPIMGSQGAAIAFMVSILVWNIVAVFQIRRYYGFYTFGFVWGR